MVLKKAAATSVLAFMLASNLVAVTIEKPEDTYAEIVEVKTINIVNANYICDDYEKVASTNSSMEAYYSTKEEVEEVIEESTENTKKTKTSKKKKSKKTEDTSWKDKYDNLDLLATCVEAEAGNQGLEGKRLVVDVILNRVDSDTFPDTVYDVITSPKQFSSYWDGNMASVSTITDETWDAIKLEIEERSYPGIYYFTAGWYNPSGTPWKKVGDHYFSTM